MSNVWSKETPTRVGNYLIKSWETGYKEEPVEVFIHEKYKELVVHDCMIGEYPLDLYHDNLVDVEWLYLGENK